MWERESTRLVEDHGRRVCRQEAGSVADKRLARATDSEPASRRAVRLAEAMRRHAASAEQFDADPWLLNTPGGAVDLRTGQVQSHRAADFLTRMTAVAPLAHSVAGGECPTWFRVLDEATGRDATLIAYLQRLFGYALVGTVTEHIVAILHGAMGGEGKGVLLNTIAGALGDFAAVAPADMLTPQQGERHSTDLAGLAGARLVIASEIEEGRYWAEEKLKSISGGDKITARFMRGDFFTYMPQFTLVIATNHLPQLRAAGGMRRRLQIVPFRHRPLVPAPELQSKLRAEWPGILSWLVEGCLAWQKNGLAPPTFVTAATDEYFERENPVAGWLSERCVMDRDGWAGTKDLHRDFRSWAGRTGEPQLSERRFAQRLAEVGVQPERKERGRGFAGIRLGERSEQLDV